MSPAKHHLHLLFRLLKNSSQLGPDQVGVPLHLRITLDYQVDQLVDLFFELILRFAHQHPLLQRHQQLINAWLISLLVLNRTENFFSITLLVSCCLGFIALLLITAFIWKLLVGVIGGVPRVVLLLSLLTTCFTSKHRLNISCRNNSEPCDYSFLFFLIPSLGNHLTRLLVSLAGLLSSFDVVVTAVHVAVAQEQVSTHLILDTHADVVIINEIVVEVIILVVKICVCFFSF